MLSDDEDGVLVSAPGASAGQSQSQQQQQQACGLSDAERARMEQELSIGLAELELSEGELLMECADVEHQLGVLRHSHRDAEAAVLAKTKQMELRLAAFVRSLRGHADAPCGEEEEMSEEEVAAGLRQLDCDSVAAMRIKMDQQRRDLDATRIKSPHRVKTIDALQKGVQHMDALWMRIPARMRPASTAAPVAPSSPFAFDGLTTPPRHTSTASSSSLGSASAFASPFDGADHAERDGAELAPPPESVQALLQQQLVTAEQLLAEASAIPACEEASIGQLVGKLRVAQLRARAQHVAAHPSESMSTAPPPSLSDAERQDLLALVDTLKTQLQKRNRPCDSELDSVATSLHKHSVGDALSGSVALQKQLQPFNVPVFRQLMLKQEAAVQSIKNIKGDDVVTFLVGFTGAGKSTLTHFLAGSTMVRTVVDGLNHIAPTNITNPHLSQVVSGPGCSSITRYLSPVPVSVLALGRSGQKAATVLVDAPGLEDTAGPEVDASNSLGLSAAARSCRKARLLIVISADDLGSRFQGIPRIAALLASMLTDVNDMSSVTFAFTKFKRDEQSQLKGKIQHVMAKLKDEADMQANSAMLEQSLAFLQVMLDCAADQYGLKYFVDPMTGPKGAAEFLLKLAVSPSIDDTERSFSKALLTPAAERTLKLQVQLLSEGVDAALRAGSHALLEYRMGELDSLRDLIPTGPAHDEFANCCRKVQIYREDVVQQMSQLLRLNAEKLSADDLARYVAAVRTLVRLQGDRDPAHDPARPNLLTERLTTRAGLVQQQIVKLLADASPAAGSKASSKQATTPKAQAAAATASVSPTSSSDIAVALQERVLRLVSGLEQLKLIRDALAVGPDACAATTELLSATHLTVCKQFDEACQSVQTQLEQLLVKLHQSVVEWNLEQASRRLTVLVHTLTSLSGLMPVCADLLAKVKDEGLEFWRHLDAVVAEVARLLQAAPDIDEETALALHAQAERMQRAQQCHALHAHFDPKQIEKKQREMVKLIEHRFGVVHKQVLACLASDPALPAVASEPEPSVESSVPSPSSPGPDVQIQSRLASAHPLMLQLRRLVDIGGVGKAARDGFQQAVDVVHGVVRGFASDSESKLQQLSATSNPDADMFARLVMPLSALEAAKWVDSFRSGACSSTLDLIRTEMMRFVRARCDELQQLTATLSVKKAREYELALQLIHKLRLMMPLEDQMADVCAMRQQSERQLGDALMAELDKLASGWNSDEVSIASKREHLLWLEQKRQSHDYHTRAQTFLSTTTFARIDDLTAELQQIPVRRQELASAQQKKIDDASEKQVQLCSLWAEFCNLVAQEAKASVPTGKGRGSGIVSAAKGALSMGKALLVGASVAPSMALLREHGFQSQSALEESIRAAELAIEQLSSGELTAEQKQLDGDEFRLQELHRQHAQLLVDPTPSPEQLSILKECKCSSAAQLSDEVDQLRRFIEECDHKEVSHAMQQLPLEQTEQAIAFTAHLAAQSLLLPVKERAQNQHDTIAEYLRQYAGFVKAELQHLLGTMQDPSRGELGNKSLQQIAGKVQSRALELQQCQQADFTHTAKLLHPSDLLEHLSMQLVDQHELLSSSIQQLAAHGRVVEMERALLVARAMTRFDEHVKVPTSSFKELWTLYVSQLHANQKTVQQNIFRAIQERQYDQVASELDVLQVEVAAAEASAAAAAAAAASNSSSSAAAPAPSVRAPTYTTKPVRDQLSQSLRAFIAELSTTSSVLPSPVSVEAAQGLRKELLKYAKFEESPTLQRFVMAAEVAELQRLIGEVREHIGHKLSSSVTRAWSSVSNCEFAEAEKKINTLQSVYRLIGQFCSVQQQNVIKREIDQLPERVLEAADHLVKDFEQRQLSDYLSKPPKDLSMRLKAAQLENPEYESRASRLQQIIVDRFQSHVKKVETMQQADERAAQLIQCDQVLTQFPEHLLSQLRQTLDEARKRIQDARDETKRELKRAFNTNEIGKIAEIYHKYRKSGAARTDLIELEEWMEKRARDLSDTIADARLTVDSPPSALRLLLTNNLAQLCLMRSRFDDRHATVADYLAKAERTMHSFFVDCCRQLAALLKDRRPPEQMDATVNNWLALFVEFDSYFSRRDSTGFADRWRSTGAVYDAVATYLAAAQQVADSALQPQLQPHALQLFLDFRHTPAVRDLYLALQKQFANFKLEVQTKATPAPAPAPAARVDPSLPNVELWSDDAADAWSSPAVVEVAPTAAPAEVRKALERIQSSLRHPLFAYEDVQRAARVAIEKVAASAQLLCAVTKSDSAMTVQKAHEQLRPQLILLAGVAHHLSAHLPLQLCKSHEQCVAALTEHCAAHESRAMTALHKDATGLVRQDLQSVQGSHEYFSSIVQHLDGAVAGLVQTAKQQQENLTIRCGQLVNVVQRRFKDRGAEDPLECAKDLCAVKLLSNSLPWFKKTAFDVVDALLLHYQRVWVPPNPNALNILGVQLQLSAEGSNIVDEHTIYKGKRVSEFNQLVATQDLPYVVEHFKETKQAVDAPALANLYMNFRGSYDQFTSNLLRNREFVPTLVNLIITRSKQTGVEAKALRQAAAGKRRGQRGIVSDLLDRRAMNVVPELLAGIFALWTFERSAGLQPQQQQGPKSSYLVQPHVPQVVAIFQLLGLGGGTANKDRPIAIVDHLIEIGTGEGKSVTCAVVAVVLALFGMDVSCACFSAYLSARDEQDFKWLFDLLQVRERIFYGTFNQVCENQINRDGDLREAVERMFALTDGDGAAASASSSMSSSAGRRSKQKGKAGPGASGERRPLVLLVDEVDVFFQEQFYGQCYRPVARLRHPLITALFDDMWSVRQQMSSLSVQVFRRRQSYLDVERLFGVHADLLLEALKDMLAAVQDFAYDYVVLDDRIGVQEHDGIAFNITYGYKTAFAYYCERDKTAAGLSTADHAISPSSCEQQAAIRLACGNFSYAEMPHDADLIIGVTGTLQTLSEPEKRAVRDDFKIQRFTYMPSAFGKNKLVFAQDKAVKITNQADFHPAIANEINQCILSERGGGQRNRAVFVFFETDAKLHAFTQSAAFTSIRDYCGILTEAIANAPGAKEAFVKDATQKGRMSLLTQSFGRGTDFIVSDPDVKAAGGVHVIQTFLSSTVSDERQIKGRTARQTNPGSFSMVLLDSELEEFGVTAAVIEQCRRSGSFYDTINQLRNHAFATKYEARKADVQSARDEHKQSQLFVENLRAGRTQQVKEFLLARNQGANAVRSRTLITLDGTGSMGAGLEAAKTTVFETFQRAGEILQQHGFPTNCFEVMISIYRNYSSPLPLLLQSGGWESAPAPLRQFLDTVRISGGLGSEAAEIAFAHANRQIEQARDANAPPLSQVIHIGDAPSNSRDDVNRKRDFMDFSAPDHPWKQPTYWEDEVAALAGAGVPVHTFYIGRWCKEHFEEIARRTGGTSHELDLTQPQSNALTDLLTVEVLKSVGGQGRGDVLAQAYKDKFQKSYVS